MGADPGDRLGPGGRRRGIVECRLHDVDTSLEDLGQQFVLRGEVVVQRPGLHADHVRELAERRSFVAVPQEQRGRFVHDAGSADARDLGGGDGHDG